MFARFAGAKAGAGEWPEGMHGVDLVFPACGYSFPAAAFEPVFVGRFLIQSSTVDEIFRRELPEHREQPVTLCDRHSNILYHPTCFVVVFIVAGAVKLTRPGASNDWKQTGLLLIKP